MELTAISLSIVLGIPATATLSPRLSTSFKIFKPSSQKRFSNHKKEENNIQQPPYKLQLRLFEYHLLQLCKPGRSPDISSKLFSNKQEDCAGKIWIHLVYSSILNIINYLIGIMTTSRRLQKSPTTLMNVVHRFWRQLDGIFRIEPSISSLKILSIVTVSS